MNRQINYWTDSCNEKFHAPELDEDLSADLVVIGGGYTGCAAALEAANLGINVVLLEANIFGFGGSGRNVGLVNAGLWLPPDQVVQKLGNSTGSKLVDGLSNAPELVFDLIKQNQIQCDPKQNGTLHCAHNENGWMELQRRFAQWETRKAPVNLLDSTQIHQATGTAAYQGGLLDQRAGTIQPLGYVRGLARAAHSRGAMVFENSPVIKIKRNDTSWTAYTKKARIHTRTILLAQNAYAEGIVGKTGSRTAIINYFQAVTEPIPTETWVNILPQDQGSWDTAPIMTSIRKAAQNRVIIGAMGRPEGIGKYIHLTWAQKKMAQLFPALKNVGFESHWHGKISMSKDYLPKIMQLDDELFSIFGFSGRGIAPGTFFGTKFAQYIEKNTPEILPIDISHNYKDPYRQIKTLVFELGARISHIY